MATVLICLAVAIIGGLLLSRVTKLFNLPAVTAYLVAGLLMGPFCLGAFGVPGLGFNSLHQVEGFSIVTQTALGFIAFAIGNEFRMGQLKSMGSKAITIGILQAVVTTILVDIVLICLHLAFPNIISLPAAIVLGAIASATAPAATLMVIRQYKADGPLTKLLMLVVAIDDAVGLLLFSVSFGIATALSQVSLSGGQRPYEDFMWGGNPGAIRGIPADVNPTVAVTASTATLLPYAYLGDWSAFRWGYAANMPLEVIEYGNPDNDANAGDLKGHNQIYIRGEVFVGWGILVPAAFAMIQA